MIGEVKYENGARIFLFTILASQLYFNNGIYLFLGIAVFYFLFSKIHQPFKPSIFTLLLFYHFLQIEAGIWFCNYLEEDINFRSPNQATATIAALAGITVLFTPLIYFHNKLPSISINKFREHARKLDTTITQRLYIIAFFVSNIAIGFAFFFPGLTQVVFSVLNIKWFLFLLFAFQCVLKKEKLKQLTLFISIEVLSGFFSFFSDFKTILFYLVLIYLSLLERVTLKKVVIAILILAAAYFGGTFWTSIKGDYRSFLNQGNGSQNVQVSKNDALNKLIDLSQNQSQNKGDNKTATSNFLDRLQYTYHLAKTMDQVPAIIPYQKGDNWWSSISFSLTPRILNPNKGIYEASLKASKYTGITYAGASSGTSVSLGYFADGYIDFGYAGILLTLLLLGLVYGKCYFYFATRSSSNYIFNYSVVCALFFEFITLEMDSTYLAGRLFANLLSFYFLQKFLFPFLFNYVSKKSAT